MPEAPIVSQQGAPAVSDDAIYKLWRENFGGVSELIKYIDNGWFIIQATTAVVGSDSFPCLQVTPTNKKDYIGFISIGIFWELLLNIYTWVVGHCGSHLLLIRFLGLKSTESSDLTPVNAVCRQLLQLLQSLYGIDTNSQQLYYLGSIRRRTIQELKSMVIIRGNPFDIWLTAYSDTHPILRLVNDRNSYYIDDSRKKFESTFGKLMKGFSCNLQNFRPRQCNSLDVYPLDINSIGATTPLEFKKIGRTNVRIQSGLCRYGYIREDVLLCLQKGEGKELTTTTKATLELSGKSVIHFTGEIVSDSRCDVTIGYNDLKKYKSILDYNSLEFWPLGMGNKRLSPEEFFIPMHSTSSGSVIEIYQSSSPWKSFGPLTTHRHLALISTFHSRNYISRKMAKWIQLHQSNTQDLQLTILLPCTFVVERSSEQICLRSDTENNLQSPHNKNGTELLLWHERIPFTIKSDEKVPFILGNSFLAQYRLILDFSKNILKFPGSNHPKFSKTKNDAYKRENTCLYQLSWKQITYAMSLIVVAATIILRMHSGSFWTAVERLRSKMYQENGSGGQTTRELRIRLDDVRDWGCRSYTAASDMLIQFFKGDLLLLELLQLE